MSIEELRGAIERAVNDALVREFPAADPIGGEEAGCSNCGVDHDSLPTYKVIDAFIERAHAALVLRTREEPAFRRFAAGHFNGLRTAASSYMLAHAKTRTLADMLEACLEMGLYLGLNWEYEMEHGDPVAATAEDDAKRSGIDASIPICPGDHVDGRVYPLDKPQD